MREFAEYYYFVYWFVVLLMTLNKFSVIKRNSCYGVIRQQDNYGPILLFMLFYILFFGFRPITRHFGDTGIYASTYNYIQNFGILDPYSGDDGLGSDWLFNLLMFLSAPVMSVYYFFFICMVLYIIFMYAGCKKFDSRHGATLMLFCVGAFEFYTFSVNGVRNGIACSILILALAFLCQRKWPTTLILAFAAMGFHKSAALPVVAMFLTFFIR